MKFVATTMLLSCAAALSAVKPHFKCIDNHLASLSVVPEVRQTVTHVWQPFTHIFHHAPTARRNPAPTVVMPKVAMPREETFRLIQQAALRHNVPAAFVKSIVAVESNFDCSAVSPKGAIGLMQLMPATAQQYDADPSIPEQNLDAGTHYLRVLMDRYQNQNGRCSLQRVTAAYHAGPGMVDKYSGIPPFPETRQYVVRVMGFLRKFQLADRRGVYRQPRAGHGIMVELDAIAYKPR
jgi:Transglycosylase SLT domain